MSPGNDCFDIIKRIDDALTILHSSRAFYREFLKILDENPRLSTNNHFLIWVADNYMYCAAMSLRRLLDNTRGTISIIKLFEALDDNSHLLNKTYYISHFTADCSDPQFAEECFSSFARLGHTEGLNLRILRDQIESFSSSWGRLKTYIDERVAHEAKSPSEDLPTVSDLDICIDKVAEVMKIIIAFLTFGSITSFEPEIQYRWKEIFSFPWIEPSR